jgi:hypothetical protein
LTAVVFSLIPEALLQSNSIYRDPIFLAALIWSIYYLQKALKFGEKRFLVRGLCLLLLSSMFRAEGLVVIVLFVVTLLLGVYRNSDRRKQYMKLLFICLLAPILVAVTLTVITKVDPTYTSQIIDTFSGYSNSKIWENYKRISEQLQLINDATPSSDVGVHFGIESKRMIPAIFALALLHVFTVTLLFLNTIFLVIGIINTKWSISNKFVFSSAIAYLFILYSYFICYDLMLNRWILAAIAMVCP